MQDLTTFNVDLYNEYTAKFNQGKVLKQRLTDFKSELKRKGAKEDWVAIHLVQMNAALAEW